MPRKILLRKILNSTGMQELRNFAHNQSVLMYIELVSVSDLSERVYFFVLVKRHSLQTIKLTD